MSPYEIVSPGGSVEHLNPEPGKVWLERAIHDMAAHVWINPTRRKSLAAFAVDADDRRNL